MLTSSSQCRQLVSSCPETPFGRGGAYSEQCSFLRGHNVSST